MDKIKERAKELSVGLDKDLEEAKRLLQAVKDLTTAKKEG